MNLFFFYLWKSLLKILIVFIFLFKGLLNFLSRGKHRSISDHPPPRIINGGPIRNIDLMPVTSDAKRRGLQVIDVMAPAGYGEFEIYLFDNKYADNKYTDNHDPT